MGFPFLSPFFALFAILLPFFALPFCCSCRGVIWPVPLGLFGSVAYSSPNDSMWSLVSNSCHFGLFLAHFIAYGFFCPIYFPWTSLAQFLVLHTNGLSLTPLGFPGPIALFLILGAHGLPINPLLSYFITSGLLWPILTLLLYIMPMSFLLLFLGSFRPICFPQGPFMYFMGLWTTALAIKV